VGIPGAIPRRVGNDEPAGLVEAYEVCTHFVSTQG
jgi:hypothetical protein